MRYTIIDGVEDDIRFDLGSDVMIVAAVQEVGDTADYLVYRARLTGEEVLELMKKARRPDMFDAGEIVADHHYIVTAYDD